MTASKPIVYVRSAEEERKRRAVHMKAARLLRELLPAEVQFDVCSISCQMFTGDRPYADNTVSVQIADTVRSTLYGDNPKVWLVSSPGKPLGRSDAMEEAVLEAAQRMLALCGK